MASNGSRQPSSADDTRQHIVSSLFARRGEDGIPEETLISFLKVYEDEGGNEGQKTRYLMLAVSKLGKVIIHKAKRNSNLSFSKGKTWHLEDIRVVEVMGPNDFALTMTIRRYHWSTEKPKDQTHFLNSIVKVYKTYTKGESPQLINFSPPPTNGNGVGSNGSSNGGMSPATSPISAIPPPLSKARTESFSSQTSLQPPPPLRTQRSGSSSSIVSSHGNSISQYAPSRPSLDDEQRTPTGSTYGRSPLSEGTALRKTSTTDTRAPMHNGGASGNGGPSMTGLGIGMSPSQPRKMSEDRLKDNTRRPSNDVLVARPTSRSDTRPGSGHERQERPSSRQDVSERPSSRTERPGRPNSRNERERELRDAKERVDAPAPTAQPPSLTVPTQQPAPTIMTTQPSPSIPAEATFSAPISHNKPQRRASFHPPPLNTAFSREVLLTSRSGMLPGSVGLTIDDEVAPGEEGEVGDTVMTNVEELLEGFDWTASAGVGENGRKKGSADAIESRLMDELAALDSANIHAFLESDDRITQVLGHIDEALLELEDIDMQITGYKMQLNAVSDDISYIESQNRGLQVQTSNQQALLDEIRQLLQIVEVPQQDLRTLTQESPQTARGVQALENAAASLYKALQAGRDTANAEVAATIARMREYQQSSSQFSSRLLEFLNITFKFQSETTLAEYRKVAKRKLTLQPHEAMEEDLLKYQGLILYVKEMDEDRYQGICSSYIAAISHLHQNEMKDLLMNLMSSLNATASEDRNEASFANAMASSAPKAGAIRGAMQKSSTVMGLRNVENARKEKKSDDNSRRVSELFKQALMDIINQIVREEAFVAAFLHITDTESTFADHMELESYFRRQAARYASKGMPTALNQLARNMLDLMFGYVEVELRQWTEAAVERNPIHVVGVIGVTEELAREAEEENTTLFFSVLFSKQIARQQQVLEAFVNEQIRTIDAAKLTVKKRKGVIPFVRHFPVFVEKLESQVEGFDSLPIRQRVDGIYERVVNSVFANLQQLAKMDRADGQAAEDKGQLNYHIIMIENMHHFIDDLQQLNIAALNVYLERAKGLYQENLSTYLKMMLRRPFARLLDFFDGVEKLLQTTPANEVQLHASYNRSALKKVLKDNGAKDIRKAIDTMSKRVEKHFTNEDELNNGTNTEVMIGIVWKEMTAELKGETERAQLLISKCFSESGLGLEFGPADIEAACKRAR
ncbi:exocyst complex component 1, partial [Tremellales sp. Uapishka_1]